MKGLTHLTKSVGLKAPLTPDKKAASSKEASSKIKIIKTTKKDDASKAKSSALKVPAKDGKKTSATTTKKVTSSKDKDKKSSLGKAKKAAPAKELEPTATSARMFEAMSQMMEMLSD